MKIRIGKEDCLFYVNEEKRTVTCVIKNIDDKTCSDATYFFFIDHSCNKNQVSLDYIKNYVNKTYVGVAKCAQEDKWNEEIGRKIAFSKAKAAFYKDFFKTFRAYIDFINNAAQTSKELYDVIFEKVHANVEKLSPKQENVNNK